MQLISMPRSVTFVRLGDGKVAVACGPYSYNALNVQRLANAMRKADMPMADVLAVAVALADRADIVMTIDAEQWDRLAPMLDVVR